MGSTSWPEPHTDPNLDRIVSDVQYEQMALMYAGNGLYGDPSMPSLVYADASGRNVKLRPHRLAMVHGHPFRTDAAGVTLPVSNSTGARTDLVVLRLNRATWKVTPEIREGVVGGGVPAPQQDADAAGAGTGLWELPVARIATPSGSAGITAAMVTDTAWYLAPQAYVGRSGARPPIAPGIEFTEVDTARRMAVIGSSWGIVGEHGPWTRITSISGGWQTANAHVYAQRRNGWTYLQGLIYKNTPSSTLAAGVDTPVCVLPATFRPHSSFYLTGAQSGNLMCRLYMSANDGVLSYVDHPALGPGQFVHFGPVVYPSSAN